MKSVLVSLDFVYNQHGKLVPVELNTNTDEYVNTFAEITNENFLETGDYFNHAGLHTFLQDNDLSKVKVIATRDNRFIKAFCEYYNYEYSLVKVNVNQNVIPEVEDVDDTLIIRIAYDSYALIDDLYARDMYEFHNLIASESFASPVCFTENSFDTISEFEDSQIGNAPNYIVKPRTPSYVKTDYPKVYKFTSAEQLQSVKSNLTTNEFITKFEYHTELSLVNDRVVFLRSMDLVIGSDLDTLNLLTYKHIHSIAQTNENLVIDYTVDDNNILHPLEAGKYYPTWETRVASAYHFDQNDKALLSDGTLKPFTELEVSSEESELLTFLHADDVEEQVFRSVKVPTAELNNFTTGSTQIEFLNSLDKSIFVNITATNDTYGEYTWHDGFANNYYVDKHNDEEDVTWFVPAGELEINDKVYVYDKSVNLLIPFTVTAIKFDTKDLDVYKINLKQTPKFFTELDSSNNLFLLQHNDCSRFCIPDGGAICNSFCIDCGKNSPGCINCGGADTDFCED